MSDDNFEFILNTFTIAELKNFCSRNGLKVSGSKLELSDRLQKHFYSMEDFLNSLTIPFLKQICEKCTWEEDGETYSLYTSGRKNEIVDRIIEHLEESDEECDESEDAEVEEETEEAEVEAEVEVKPETPSAEVKPSSNIEESNNDHIKASSNPSENIPTDSPETLKALEEIMNGLLVSETMKIGGITSGFCGACKKRHAKQWFDFENEEKSFYLCRISTTSIVTREGAKEKSTYTNLTPGDFINQYSSAREKAYVSNDSSLESGPEEKISLFQKMRSYFQRNDVQQGMKKRAETLLQIIEIVGTPPFTQIAKLGGLALKQYTSDKAHKN